MIPGLRPDAIPADERTPELEEILAGRDDIALDQDLLADPSGGVARSTGGGAPSSDDLLSSLGEGGADGGVPTTEEEGAQPYSPDHEVISIRVKRMPVSHRIKLALAGGHEARIVLSRDPVRLVQRCVLMNPRITLEEVLAIAKNRSIHGTLLRQVGEQRDWVRQYSIRVALVTNPKTPLQVSLKLMPGLQEREVRVLAKSRNVSSVIQAQARRMLLRKNG